jgi:hypothetical protein
MGRATHSTNMTQGKGEKLILIVLRDFGEQRVEIIRQLL